MLCCSASSQYNLTKRKLDNLNKELTAFGSKPLTNQEKRRFRHRYKQHLNRVENIKVKRKEKRKLQEQIHQFRENFRHLGIFEMESDATDPVSKPPEMAENNARDSQGRDVLHNKFTSNVRSDKLSDNCFEARLQSLKSLENSDVLDPRDLRSNFDNLVKEQASVKEEEQQRKFSCGKAVFKNNYIPLKTELENLIAYLTDEEQIEDIVKQFNNVCRDINKHGTQLSTEESSDLHKLRKEFKRRANEKNQTKDNICTPQTSSKQLDLYNHGQNQLHFEPERKCNYMTVVNKSDQNTRLQERMENAARIHSFCNKPEPSGTDHVLRLTSNGRSFDTQSGEEGNENVDMETSQNHNDQTIQVEAFHASFPMKEENKVSNFHGVSSYRENRSKGMKGLRRDEQIENTEPSRRDKLSDGRNSDYNTKDTTYGGVAICEMTHFPNNISCHNYAQNSNRSNKIKQEHKSVGLQHVTLNMEDNAAPEHVFRDKSSPSDDIGRASMCIIQLKDSSKQQCSSRNIDNCSYEVFSQATQKLIRDHSIDDVCEIAQEAKEQEPLQILDVHQYFRDDFDLNSVDSMEISDRIDTIHRHAKTFCSKVHSFDEEKYSLEYFILDEKLMRLIEKLDKIKIQHDPELTNKKIEVIQFIKHLHSVLDQRAKE